MNLNQLVEQLIDNVVAEAGFPFYPMDYGLLTNIVTTAKDWYDEQEDKDLDAAVDKACEDIIAKHGIADPKVRKALSSAISGKVEIPEVVAEIMDFWNEQLDGTEQVPDDTALVSVIPGQPNESLGEAQQEYKAVYHDQNGQSVDSETFTAPTDTQAWYTAFKLCPISLPSSNIVLTKNGKLVSRRHYGTIGRK